MPFVVLQSFSISNYCQKFLNFSLSHTSLCCSRWGLKAIAHLLFSRILEDEGWKNCADFFVGMNAATSLQTSRVCCREKDFPPSPPSILHILFFIYLYRLLQLLYGVCYFYMSLCDGEFYGSSFFYTEASKVSSILVSRSRKPFCVLLCFILWTRL